MEIALNEDQIEIARQARRFLENESPMAFVRSMFEDERGFTDAFWTKMVEMGWTAMTLPEAHGGLGMNLLDLVVVLMEMGRSVMPGPFFSTVLLAAETILQAGSEAQKQKILPSVAAGQMRGTLALQEPDGGADPGHICLEARSEGDGFVLRGTKLPVPDAHIADFMVCAARTRESAQPDEGITLFLVDPKAQGVSITPLPSMDGTRKISAVSFEGLRLPREHILGDLHDGWGPLNRVLTRAQVGLCADCVGGAQRAMEIATEYAKIRIQFDQPIGAYQAIKHRCAQMYVEAESARSVLYWAAWAQDHADPEEAALSASVAKAYCSETYRNITTGAVQVLGGTGFSWEHDIHLYLKRAKGNEVALGDPIYHREQVARRMVS